MLTENTPMPQMSPRQMAAACGGRLFGLTKESSCPITGVVTDNRQVLPGSLFAAIVGEHANGHDFIEDAYARGASCVLCEKPPAVGGTYILVNSTQKALGDLAAYYRSTLTLPVVAVTGSVGKTSTKEMISSVLSRRYDVQKTAGNYNNELGLALTIFTLRPHHEAAVLELGISQFGEMDRLGAIAQPDIAVVSNIGACHLKDLGSREGVLTAKSELFAHLRPGGVAVLNGDDDLLRTKSVVNGRPAFFYGIGQKSGGITKQVYATDILPLGLSGVRARMHTQIGSFTAQIPLPGEHNAANAAAATAVGQLLHLSLEEIAAGIAAVQTVGERMHIIHSGGITILDDCYNANPMSVRAALLTLASAEGRKIAVLGDMGELGEEERALHEQVGRFAAEQSLSALFAAGDLADAYACGLLKTDPACEIFCYKTREEMTSALLSYVRPGDVILVKASHFMEFSRVTDALAGLDFSRR